MHPSWKIEADRVKSDPDPVGFGGDFGKRFTIQIKKSYKDEVTRHHVINIQVLQDFWNEAMVRADRPTYEAMGAWCAMAPARLTSLLDNPSTLKPDDFQRQFCWNPFNIVIGPSTTHRVGDPGSGFDFIQFQSFPKFAATSDASFTENLARQEFNTHMERLKRINAYMGRYTGGTLYSQEVENLRTLLKSDRPSCYPNLFKVLRAKIDPSQPEYSQAADTEKLRRTAGRLKPSGEPVYVAQFSPDRLPGAITHPDLWVALTDMPAFGFETHGQFDVYKGRLQSRVVPWVNTSYLPEPAGAGPVRASEKYKHLFETGTAGLPVRDPAARVVVEKGVVDAAFADRFVKAVQPLEGIARQSGLRVFVVGPNYSEIFRAALDRVADEAAKLSGTGYRLSLASLPNRSELKAVEARLYYV